jgi:hypothetical protein
MWPDSVQAAAPIDPQYIFVRKDNTCSNCYNWNGFDPNQINLNAINEIFGAIGTKGTNSRRLGVGVLFTYNQIPMENLKQSLSRLLTYSQAHDFPVFIVLDGFLWWNNRPDLWNWWDPGKPGYNPANKNNVEWTCWDSSCAIQKSWLNWGVEMEIKPHPNLASPAFVEANKNSLKQLVPIIVNWYTNLPDDKKYLFGGFSGVTEVDMGVNYYYYKNGIPTGKGLPDSVQLGYAAVKTAGLKSSGTITIQDLDEVIRKYETALNETAFSLGIPRNKIFNHNGTKDADPPWLAALNPNVFPSANAALNAFAAPGWSLYDTAADNPQNLTGLQTAFAQIGTSEWGAPEWRTFSTDTNVWASGLRNTLNLHNNRFVNVANWEGGQGVKDKPYAIQAIRTVLNETPSCWVTSPFVNPPQVSGNAVTLSWQAGEHNEAIYLNVSTSNEFNFDGGFKTINIANVAVTGQNTWQRSGLSNGTYYWQLVADGCTNQRRRAYGSFIIGSHTIDITDLHKLLSAFTSIFDYNKIVENYGK